MNIQNNLEIKYQRLRKRQGQIEINIHKYIGKDFDENLGYIDRTGKYWWLQSSQHMKIPVQRWVEQFEGISHENIIFVYGWGYSDYIRQLVKKYPENVVVVYEPNEENIIRLLCEEDFQDIYSADKFILIAGERRKAAWINLLDSVITYDNHKKLVSVRIPNYHKIWEEEYEEYHNAIKNKLENVLVEKYTVIGQEEVRARNAIYNLKSFFCEAGIGEIKEAINERMMEKYPVVVVAAGPSLDKNVAILKEYLGQAFIICVESALNKMIENAIIPDLIVAIDPTIGTKFTIDKEEYKYIPLLTDVECSWEYVDLFKGRRFYTASKGEYYNSILSTKTVAYLGTGGSVANTAFSLALYLGAKNIILIGQDLSYPDNKFHADGIMEDEGLVDDSDNPRFFYVDGIDGKPVITEKIMDIYRRWYEDMILIEDCNVIDATEGGALIHGTMIMSLRDALKKYCPKEKADFKQLLNQADYFLDERQQMLAMKKVKEIYENIDKNIITFKDIRQVYAQLQQLNQRKQYTSNEFRKCIRQIAEFVSKVENDKEMNFYRMYTNQKNFEVRDCLSEKEQDAFLEIHKMTIQGMEMVDAYIQAADKLKKDWETFFLGK